MIGCFPIRDHCRANAICTPSLLVFVELIQVIPNASGGDVVRPRAFECYVDRVFRSGLSRYAFLSLGEFRWPETCVRSGIGISPENRYAPSEQIHTLHLGF